MKVRNQRGKSSSLAADSAQIPGVTKRTKGIVPLVLAALLCITGFPVLSGAPQAEAQGRDITAMVATETAYQILDAEGKWVDIADEQVASVNSDNELSCRAVIDWSVSDGYRLVNGDYFTLKVALGGGLKAKVFRTDGTTLGVVDTDESGEVTVSITELDEAESGEDVSSGTVEIEFGDTSSEDASVDGEASSRISELTLQRSELTSAPLFTSVVSKTTRGPSGDPNDAGSFGQISLVKFVQLANGCMGGMALDSSGRVWTFGYNLYGELGISKTLAQQNYYGGMKRVPYFINNNINIIEIGATYETRYALSDTGKVYAWGDGGSGAMGNGTTTRNNSTPIEVPGLPKISHLYSSDSYLGNGSCFALAEDGTLWAWGDNTGGKLGFNSTANVTSPQQVTISPDFTDGTRKIVKVTCGEVSAHVLDDQGDVWSAGADSNGEQGNGAGTTASRVFVMMDRTATGMARVVDIDTSYGRLQDGAHGRAVAADENGDAWEWGRTYGDGSLAASAVVKQTPQKIVIDPAEISAIGYTPKAQKVTASEMVNSFVDQHGRPWAWGSGYYFGFGRDGGYGASGGSNTELVPSTAAQQRPRIVGDGDTQYMNSDAKVAVHAGGTLLASSRFGYGFNDLHPTIYDEKYMLKDDSGVVLDIEGNRIKYASTTSVDGVSGLTRGMYYRVDGAGKISSPATTGTPALNPTDALWINLAFQPVPYIAQYDMSLSAYSFIDSDGNLFKWGNDGSGAVAWGWDYESKYDQNGSLTAGLYDRYTYEVMYMRGAPTIDVIDLKAGLKDNVKVYKDPDTGDVSNIAEVKIHIPATTASAELESNVHSDVIELKYVFVPYDNDDPNFIVDNTAMTYDQFMSIYNATDASLKGDLIPSPVYSGSTAQDLTYEVNVPNNGRVIAWAVNERYVDGPGGTKEYVNINNVSGAFVADNVYTPVSMNHKGIGIDFDANESVLYAPTTDNVVKTNDDAAATGKPFDKTLYGLPLDAHDKVIGATKAGDGTVTVDPAAVPTYGYDTTQIKSYEEVGDVGLPTGIKPYWMFKEYLDDAKTQLQPTLVSKEMNDEGLLSAGYAHTFYYEQDPDYWTKIEGEKTWDDFNDRLSFRPDSIELTLKQYARDTTTGAKGAFIKDVETKTVTPNGAGLWPFSFGSQMSYEYTYEIEETEIPVYNTVISYPNLVVGGTTNEDLSGVTIVNTLNLKPAKFNKVDSSKNPITSDVATFTLTNATSGGKVFDTAGVEQASITLSTTAANPYIVMPIQKPGTYHLTETKAPSGYNLLTMDIVVELDATGNVKATLGSVPLEEVALSGADVDTYSKAYNVINKTAGELPKAGGIGTLLLTIVSSVILFAAAFLLRRRNRAAASTG